MSNPLARRSWSPYAVGATIGVLSWFAFATADRPIGITTAFEHTAALVGQAVAGDTAREHAYYAEKRAEGEPPKIGWEWMLVLGVLFGSLLSARLSGDRTRTKVPPLWAWRFGPGVARRFVAAFLGAALMLFGARLAGGCTSGHGISGTLQLAVSSWIFVVVIFAVAVATALLLYGPEGASHLADEGRADHV